MASHIRPLITSFIVLLLHNKLIIAWGDSGKVLLKDIDVLTLSFGKMTKGSRSAPVPQLDCVEGGTAPCNAFKPRTVQCYNRGSDGTDVQWECKTDMDNAYRFGETEVSCEGYNYPDDPYVLKGSCGLRYNIDYTIEGHQQERKQHDYYGDSQSKNYYGSNSNNYYNTKSSKSWNFADIIVLGAMGLMIYAFYATCISPRRNIGEDANSTTNEDYPSGGGGGGGYGWHTPSAPPPPGSGGGTYGFNSDYTDGASCGRNRSNYQSRSAFGGSGASGSGGGGFWTGAATGGLLGYMFGNRNTYGNNRRSTWGAQGYGGGWGSGSSWGNGGGYSRGPSTSTGSRSSLGFGGTSRR